MKKSRLLNIITENIFSCLLAMGSIISLIIDNVVKSFLDNCHEAKLIIILVGVFSAYHVVFSSAMKKIVEEELGNTNAKIDNLGKKTDYFNGLVSFEQLDAIERKHGCDSQNIGGCKIWIIANELQESSTINQTEINDLINTIYDNITKYRVQYYYVLPDTDKSKKEIKNLSSSLGELQKRKKRKVKGGIFYKFSNCYAENITSDYFDIVLYVDCHEDGSEYFINNSTRCEGYQCFSNYSTDNAYFYQKIVGVVDKYTSILSKNPITDFEKIKIQEN